MRRLTPAGAAFAVAGFSPLQEFSADGENIPSNEIIMPLLPLRRRLSFDRSAAKDVAAKNRACTIGC